MKIGFDAKRLFRNFTGLGNYSRTLVANLSDRYADDKLVLLTERISDSADVAQFTKPPYEVVRPKHRFLWRLWRMSKDVAREKIDIYHGLSHDLPLGIKKSGARTIVTIHDVCYKTFPAMFPLFERMIYSWKYRHSCQAADCIVAISQSTARDIVRYFGVDESKIEVIYQAINPAFYTPISRQIASQIVEKYGIKGDYALYVGSINSRKNLKGIIQAYGLLDEQHRLPLVVIGGGGGDYLTECLKEAERLDVARYITHLQGISSMQTLQAFYTAARVMIYPSFYEGFGLPVAEALLCHCPVITSTVSSLPEAGGDGALYIDPTNTEEIAQSIAKILDDRDFANKLTTKGHTYVRDRFDPAKLTAQMHQLYEKLMK